MPGYLPLRGQYTFSFQSKTEKRKALRFPGADQAVGLLTQQKNSLARIFNVGVPGIEPGPRVPKTRILPIYYTPI